MSQRTDVFDPAARWAAPDGEALLSPELRDLLRQAFAIEEGAGGSPAAGEPPVGPSRLPDPARAALAAAVGPEHVVGDDAARAAHANGMSYLDLVRRSAAPPAAPDAVVVPADHAEVAAV